MGPGFLNQVPTLPRMLVMLALIASVSDRHRLQVSRGRCQKMSSTSMILCEPSLKQQQTTAGRVSRLLKCICS